MHLGLQPFYYALELMLTVSSFWYNNIFKNHFYFSESHSHSIVGDLAFHY